MSPPAEILMYTLRVLASQRDTTFEHILHVITELCRLLSQVPLSVGSSGVPRFCQVRMSE